MRVDRRAFWTWAIPLVIAHVVLSGAAIAGFKGTGVVDTLVAIMLAALVARRFRDIGWPSWIGASLLIAIMLVAPLMVTAYAIANNFQPVQFMEAMNEVGLVAGAANLLLLAIAGCVQSSRLIASIPADQVVDARQSQADASSSQVSGGEIRRPVVFAACAAVIVLIVAAGISVWRAPRFDATSTPSASPQATYQGRQVQSNGLTKDTNDFLRQLSQHPSAPAIH